MVTKCKWCGHDMIWMRGYYGRWSPFNISGSPHYCGSTSKNF